MNAARIKLAEAMELKLYLHEDDCTDILVQKEDFSYQKFDPFTDANDDFAVLEWMRKRKEDFANPEWGADWGKFSRALGHNCWYEIGDYARAACKGMEIDLEVAA